MTICTQDFEITAGDTEVITVQVVSDGNGTPVDLSAATDVKWSAVLDANTTLTKTLLGGGITLVGSGAEGKFQINFVTVDTRPWPGQFAHQATLFDDEGERGTVMNGVMTINKAIVPLP